MSAPKVNAGDAKRGIEALAVFPKDIIVDLRKNPRKTPHSQEEIHALAKSMLSPPHFQMEPVLCRIVGERNIELVFGYGRYLAAKYINDELQPDNPIRLQCIVKKMSDEEAFLSAIEENLQRRETTPVDDAHAQRTLRELYNWTDEAIAEKYKKSVQYIGKLSEILVLSAPLQAEVANGTMSVDAAVNVAKLPEEERSDVVKVAKEEDGKVNAQTVATIVRLPKGRRKKKVEEAKTEERKLTSAELRKEVAGHKAAIGGKQPKRNIAEVKEFLESMTGPAESVACRKLCEAFLEFISGKRTAEDMASDLRK